MSGSVESFDGGSEVGSVNGDLSDGFHDCTKDWDFEQALFSNKVGKEGISAD